ncbi:MAG: bifunctional ADP-heptose synthase [bacterium]|nr:bifunctional ADP-heptose synthase [bacterium]
MLTAHIPRLAGQRILVVGDVILDEYVYGTATRMSREAPIPVLEYERRQVIPGGAANPAANIVALGSEAVQIGVTGQDSAAEHLQKVLQKAGIDASGLVADPNRPTTVKTRLMAQMGLRFPQQVARLDTLSRERLSPQVEADLLQRLEAHLGTAQAILCSDYHVALLSQKLIDHLRDKARSAVVVLAADAQGDLEKYAGFTLVKCNADEARMVLRRSLTTDTDFAEAAQTLRDRLNLIGGMFITRGAQGITYATADGQIGHAPAPVVTDVYDTVGAGDTTVAVLTLAAVAKLPYADAAALANIASGIVVRHVGNYAPTPGELQAEAMDSNER